MFSLCCKNNSGADPSAFVKTNSSSIHLDTPLNKPELVAQIKSFCVSPKDRVSVSMVTRDSAFNSMSKATEIDISLSGIVERQRGKVEEDINRKYLDKPSEIRLSVELYADSALLSQQENHVLAPYIFAVNEIYMA